MRPWAARALGLAALAGCALVLYVHTFLGAWACGRDTSYCALDRDGIYTGRSEPNSRLVVAFESRRGEAPVGGFTTDADGRYCIVWPLESITPAVGVEGSDPDQPMRDWQPLSGDEPPPGCQTGDEGIPWNRSDALTSTWQYRSVFVVLVPAIALLLVAVVRGLPSRAGLVLTAAGTLLAGAVWLL